MSAVLASSVDVVAEAALAARERCRRTAVVAISGMDCAGKSTLALAALGALADRDVEVLVLHGDEFSRPTAQRHARADEALGYYRDSFDHDGVLSLLRRVRQGFAGAATLRVTDWDRDAWREAEVVVPSDGVVLLEGCFLLTPATRDAFDVGVWLEVDEATALARALARPRDLERMGGPEGVRERYGTRYLPGQRLHLAADEPRRLADLVLPG